MRLRPLDGIRGIAILLVILHHHHILESLGWVGVDLFFVLSGYLITTILLEDYRSTSFWKTFYLKRVFRLTPAFLLAIAALLSLAHHIPWIGFLGYVLFVGNWMNTTPLHISLLGGLWSLAVEEHFYMVWPGFVRKFSRHVLLTILVGVLIVSPLLRASATAFVQPFTIYFLTPFRLDPIAWGSLLALLADHAGAMRFLERRAGTFATISWVAFVALTVAFPSFDRNARSMMFSTFGYTLVAIAGFFTVAYSLTSSHSNSANRLLSWRPLGYIGQISYGMYLFEPFVSSITHHVFHIPFEGPGIIAMRRFLPFDLAVLLAVSSASFYLWEKPIRVWGIKRFLGSDRAVTRDENVVVSRT